MNEGIYTQVHIYLDIMTNSTYYWPLNFVSLFILLDWMDVHIL